MGKRYRIKINYYYDENWIGGAYYIQNLIHALNTLTDEKKPILIIRSLNENALYELRRITSYPYLEAYSLPKLNLIQRIVNFISRKIIRQNIFRDLPKYDAVFPSAFLENNELEKQIFWIPDFQEKYLPHFFSDEEINLRNNYYSHIEKNANHLVFSSKDSQKDFNKYYPSSKTNQFVLNFASYHSDIELPSVKDVFMKYNIDFEYFLCSNQFWAHKNHNVIIEAIALLKKENININVIFTGKEYDYRNPNYFSEIILKVKTLGIEDNVMFLGFIDRIDQIVLLKNCKAVIQPSLFEGWSTVIEDAKAENAFIFASNINVNIEQLENYPNNILFSPENPLSLAEKLKTEKLIKIKQEYKQEVITFGNHFMKIINEVGKNRGSL
jgi:glycosyltransferase involved in cell wall biosynthesis